MKPEQILKAPDSVKRRIRIGLPPRQYKTEGRRKFTREQILDYLRNNKFSSARKLRAGRKPGEPSVYDCVKEFGNWENARTAVFGMKPMDFGYDDEFITKSIVFGKAWTMQAYREMRKKEPETFPSLYKILKRRKWREFSCLAKQRSLKGTLGEYIKLWRKLGRTPTLEEAKAVGLVLDKAIDFYKGKHKMDEVVASWKEENEGESRSS